MLFYELAECLISSSELRAYFKKTSAKNPRNKDEHPKYWTISCYRQSFLYVKNLDGKGVGDLIKFSKTIHYFARFSLLSHYLIENATIKRCNYKHVWLYNEKNRPYKVIPELIF